MDKNIIAIIIVLVVFVCAVVCARYLIKHMMKIHDSRTFVYPKTGHEYYVHRIVKSKHPETGEWYEAVLYESIGDGAIYVRKYEDFLMKFQTLAEWKKNEK